jgi:GNAT superfamily N-acetyltransferase
MISALASQSISNTNIRKINVSRDLDQVADLIEQCFPIHLDQDGQTYIREMRKTAREMRLLGWVSSLPELGSAKAPGFVWEERGRILGNLSLIQFKDQGKNICLIANVAVHPDHRRKGIARALTNHALAYLQQNHISQVWLQVRDDNPAACQLYRSTGFVDHLVRTTWRIMPEDFEPLEKGTVSELTFRIRQKDDWEVQKRWLLYNYPESIRWNLSVDFSRFEPGLLPKISNFFEAVKLKHWAVYHNNECLGVLTWQKTRSYANNLWLAFPDNGDSLTLSFLMQRVLKRQQKRHPLSIDYPKGQFSEAFRAMGFIEFRSLIWMKQNLN